MTVHGATWQKIPNKMEFKSVFFFFLFSFFGFYNEKNTRIESDVCVLTLHLKFPHCSDDHLYHTDF